MAGDVRGRGAVLSLVAALLRGHTRHLPAAVDWHRVIDLAADHLVLPALAARLCAPALEPRLPPDAARLARAVGVLAGERQKASVAQLEAIVAGLAAAGVEPMLLKGAAYLAEGLHRPEEARLATDLDLLVEPRQMDAAAGALQHLGYEAPDAGTGEGHHHLPALVREGAPLAVELHRAPLPLQLDRLLPAEAMRRAARPSRTPGGHHVLLPAPTDLALHGIVHAQLSHGFFWRGEVVLRDLDDLARLAARHGRAVAWPAIEERMRRHGAGGALWFHLAVARELTGAALPPVPEGRAGRRALALWRRRLVEEEARDRGLELAWLAAWLPRALASRRGRRWVVLRVRALLRPWPAVAPAPAAPAEAPSPR